ncbi:MAG: OsmC family protein [Candidatus Eiseniibacteriota bacterium]
MIRKASAVWQGDLKSGHGTMTAPSGVMTNAPYTFGTRFEDKPGTNPEELIAAAHAGCFSMALSADLGKAGMTPQRVETTAAVTLETVDGKPTLTKSHLTVRAKVPGADRAKFLEIADGTRAGCPISRALRLDITMEATLEG